MMLKFASFMMLLLAGWGSICGVSRAGIPVSLASPAFAGAVLLDAPDPGGDPNLLPASQRFAIEESGGAVEVEGIAYGYLYLLATPTQPGPPDTTGTLSVIDPQGQTAFTGNYFLGGNDPVFDWVFLGVEARPGTYTLQVQFEDATLLRTFTVPPTVPATPTAAIPQIAALLDGSLQVNWAAAPGVKSYVVQLYEVGANDAVTPVSTGSTAELAWALPAGTLQTGKSYAVLLSSLDLDSVARPLSPSFYGRAIWSNDFQAPVRQPGDINGDGKVNLQDATLALQAAVGLMALSAEQAKAADLNGDGKVNAQDATLLLIKAVGL